MSKSVSKLVFYAQSTSAVISGRPNTNEIKKKKGEDEEKE